MEFHVIRLPNLSRTLWTRSNYNKQSINLRPNGRDDLAKMAVIRSWAKTEKYLHRNYTSNNTRRRASRIQPNQNDSGQKNREISSHFLSGVEWRSNRCESSVSASLFMCCRGILCRLVAHVVYVYGHPAGCCVLRQHFYGDHERAHHEHKTHTDHCAYTWLRNVCVPRGVCTGELYKRSSLWIYQCPGLSSFEAAVSVFTSVHSILWAA